MVNVIWLEGSSCSGCSVSLANLIGKCSDQGPTDIANLLINYIDTAFAKTYMSASGDLAVSCLKKAMEKDYVLVVEGGIPTAFNGMACTVFTENGHDVTMMEAVNKLAPKALKVLCVGTCSSYGGIPASGSNPLRVKSVSGLTGIKTINLPGCPVHPDWLVGTLASLICDEVPPLDRDNRPMPIFNKTVHYYCPRRPLYDKGRFATNFGQEGRCYYKLGCKGPNTIADCPSRGWNNGFNYCTQANTNCIGCTEKSFPESKLFNRAS